MTSVLIYTKPSCPYCVQALALLDKLKVAYDLINISGDNDLRQQMIERSGRHTVPQVFIHNQPIGGCDDLYQLYETGQLKELLEKN